jgi:aspartate/methionine/tyrosine aminotransferase
MTKNSSEAQTESIENIVNDIFTRSKNLEAKGLNIINLAFGAPGFETPKVIREATREYIQSDHKPLVPLAGLPELRMEVCDYIDRTRGFRPDMDQILIGSSVKAMLFSTLLTAVNRGDEIIISDPGLPYYSRLINLLGAKIQVVPRVPKKDFKLDMKKLKDLIGKKTKAIILSTPHNPTGNVLTTREVQKIFELAEKNDSLIISDESYSQILFSGRHSTPAIIDRSKDRTVILEGISHSFSMAGWGLGFYLGPVDLIDKIENTIADTESHVHSLIQFAGSESLKNASEIVPQSFDRYKKNCAALVTGLNELPGFKCPMPDGGVFAFPDISATKKTSLELAEYLLDNAGVAVMPGNVFGEQGNGHIRITFATSIQKINEAIMRLQESF